MKKVVCPACGLINLEKFVTFPHCAACGAQLSGADAEHVSTWKRPVGVPLWATIIGLCCVALSVLGILTARETSRVDQKQLLAYVQVPRHMVVGQKSWLRFTLDTTEGDFTLGSGSATNLESVSLRFSSALLRNFDFVRIYPTPDSDRTSGNARYFQFQSIERDEPIKILLKARRAGTHRMVMTVNARGCLALDQPGTLEVVPAKIKPVAKALIGQSPVTKTISKAPSR